jgi:hypothetical protein
VDLPNDVFLALTATGILVGVYLGVRRLRVARSNLRTLRALGYRHRRLGSWIGRTGLVWRLEEDMAIVLEHHAQSGNDGSFEYTHLGFFGCNCVPTGVWASAPELSELAGFSIRRGGFMVILEDPSNDAISTSPEFPARLENWAAEFTVVMKRAASLPRDLVCGACGRLTDAGDPEQRARCTCGAVYHLTCAEDLGGACVRWDCPSHAGCDEPRRLREILAVRLPR